MNRDFDYVLLFQHHHNINNVAWPWQTDLQWHNTICILVKHGFLCSSFCSSQNNKHTLPPPLYHHLVSMLHPLTNGFFVSPVRTEKISYLSPDWFSFDNHVLVGGGDREVQCTCFYCHFPLAQKFKKFQNGNKWYRNVWVSFSKLGNCWI